MADTRQHLKQAYTLIQQDQLDQAMALIRPVTEDDPDNQDAWWLMANAASEPRDARRALTNLLKLNPSYPKARDLLEKLNDLYPPRDDELIMLMEIPDAEVEPSYGGEPEPSGFEM